MLALDKNTFKEAYENKYKDIHGDEIENGNNLQRYEALGSLIRDYVSWLLFLYGISFRKIAWRYINEFRFD